MNPADVILDHYVTAGKLMVDWAKRTDTLARQGANKSFIGLEQQLGIWWSSVGNSMMAYVEEKRLQYL